MISTSTLISAIDDFRLVRMQLAVGLLEFDLDLAELAD
jgi:hypothetical protein